MFLWVGGERLKSGGLQECVCVCVRVCGGGGGGGGEGSLEFWGVDEPTVHHMTSG